jgi:hypothetical protein
VIRQISIHDLPVDKGHVAVWNTCLPFVHHLGFNVTDHCPGTELPFPVLSVSGQRTERIAYLQGVQTKSSLNMLSIMELTG